MVDQSPSPLVYVLDDEPSNVKTAAALLTAHGYRVESETDPLRALAALSANPPAALLLDIRMPKIDGFEVCRRLKADPTTRTIPIAILSVQADEADIVLGLELGASDYIQKPFREREFLARVRALLRRTQLEVTPNRTERGPLVLDHRAYKAYLDGHLMDLSPKEFQLLAYFVQQEGTVMTRAALSQHVWGIEHLASSRSVDMHVHRVHKKLGRYGEWVKGLRGVGYRFEMTEEA